MPHQPAGSTRRRRKRVCDPAFLCNAAAKGRLSLERCVLHSWCGVALPLRCCSRLLRAAQQPQIGVREIGLVLPGVCHLVLVRH